MLGWLTSFDVDRPYAPRRADVIHAVVCGERRDYLWVRLHPPIAPGEAANDEELDVVLLAPRHEGEPLTVTAVKATPVYVCRVPDAAADLPHEVDPARQVSYEIVVDEAPVAALGRGDQATVAVAAGRHTVRAEIHGDGSERIDLDLGERDRAYMRCERSFRTSLIPKMLLYQTIWRSRFLDLQLLRVEPLD